jgi:hypothetical protein
MLRLTFHSRSVDYSTCFSPVHSSIYEVSSFFFRLLMGVYMEIFLYLVLLEIQDLSTKERVCLLYLHSLHVITRCKLLEHLTFFHGFRMLVKGVEEGRWSEKFVSR